MTAKAGLSVSHSIKDMNIVYVKNFLIENDKIIARISICIKSYQNKERDS